MAKRLIYLGTHGRNPERDVQPIPEVGALARNESIIITDELALKAGRVDATGKPQPNDFAEMIYGIFCPRGDKEPYPRFRLEDVSDDVATKEHEKAAKRDHAALAASGKKTKPDAEGA